MSLRSDGFASLGLMSVICQPMLAQTLGNSGKTGRRALYYGPLTIAIPNAEGQYVSPLTVADLAAHQAVWGTTDSAPFRGRDIHTTAPSSQGFALLISLRMFDALCPESLAIDTPKAVHATMETVAEALYQRDLNLANRALDTFCFAWLWQETSNGGLAAGFQPDPAGVGAIPRVAGTSKGDTVHLAIIDANWMAVSLIQSLFFDYSSDIPLPEGWFTPQNRCVAFSLAPSAVTEWVAGGSPYVDAYNPHPQRRSGLGHGLYGRACTDAVPSAASSQHVGYLIGPTSGRLAPTLVHGPLQAAAKPDLRRCRRLCAGEAQPAGPGHVVHSLGVNEEIKGHAHIILIGPDGALIGAADPRPVG